MTFSLISTKCFPLQCFNFLMLDQSLHKPISDIQELSFLFKNFIALLKYNWHIRKPHVFKCAIWKVLTCSYTCETITAIKTTNIHLKSFLVPLDNTFLLHFPFTLPNHWSTLLSWFIFSRTLYKCNCIV